MKSWSNEKTFISRDRYAAAKAKNANQHYFIALKSQLVSNLLEVLWRHGSRLIRTISDKIIFSDSHSWAFALEEVFKGVSPSADRPVIGKKRIKVILVTSSNSKYNSS